MNVYDFDHTIYNGDCTLDFWSYCIRRHPAALRALPRSLAAAVSFRLGKCTREAFKEAFYGFLRHVPDAEAEVRGFWDTHMRKIMPWYERQKKPDDLIVSASPDFLVSAACERIGVRCIASRVDAKTGMLLGANCRGEEKARMLSENYPADVVGCFYSDSESDAPLAAMAEHAYRVRRGMAREWDRPARE